MPRASILTPACPLDPFQTSDLVGAWGLRRLRSAFNGSPARLRDTTTTGEQDAIFKGNDFNTADAEAFLAGHAGTFPAWYDQGWNALDVTQATAGNQPGYLNPGINGRPAGNFDGTNAYLSATASHSGAGMSAVAVVLADNGGAFAKDIFVFGWSSTTGRSLATAISALQDWQATDTFFLGDGSGSANTPRAVARAPAGLSTDTTNPHVIAGTVGPNLCQVYIDSFICDMRVATRASCPTLSSVNLVIGGDEIPSGNYDGKIAEVMLFARDLTQPEMLMVLANCKKYYGIQ